MGGWIFFSLMFVSSTANVFHLLHLSHFFPITAVCISFIISFVQDLSWCAYGVWLGSVFIIIIFILVPLARSMYSVSTQQAVTFLCCGWGYCLMICVVLQVICMRTATKLVRRVSTIFGEICMQ